MTGSVLARWLGLTLGCEGKAVPESRRCRRAMRPTGWRGARRTDRCSIYRTTTCAWNLIRCTCLQSTTVDFFPLAALYLLAHELLLLSNSRFLLLLFQFLPLFLRAIGPLSPWTERYFGERRFQWLVPLTLAPETAIGIISDCHFTRCAHCAPPCSPPNDPFAFPRRPYLPMRKVDPEPAASQ